MSFKERFENMQINLNQFYKLGMVCFVVIGAANTLSMCNHWGILDLGGKVSSIFGIVFNLGLFFFFKYLLSTLPETNKENPAPEEVDFDGMIEKLD